jgi:hypothetical protein
VQKRLHGGRVDSRVSEIARARKPEQALERLPAILDSGRSSGVLEEATIAYSRGGDLKRAVATAARQVDESSTLRTYAGILTAWKARSDKRWADFDAESRFKDAWTELWWPRENWSTPPRMPGGTKTSVW